MFDSNRGALGALYQETSYLTFEGTKLQGVAAIVQKLTSLPFQARALWQLRLMCWSLSLRGSSWPGDHTM